MYQLGALLPCILWCVLCQNARCVLCCAVLQIVLDEAFPELANGGSSIDVRSAIEAPERLLAVSDGCPHSPLADGKGGWLWG